MMTPREIADLLKRLNAFDGRKVDDPGVFAAWLKAAELGRWTHAEACDAAAEFYAMPADPNRKRFLEPGNITYLIRANRRNARPELRSITTGRPSTPEHRAKLRAQLVEHIGKPSRIKAREPWHDGPVARPVREIDPARVRAIARTVEGAAASLASKMSADTA